MRQFVIVLVCLFLGACGRVAPESAATVSPNPVVLSPTDEPTVVEPSATAEEIPLSDTPISPQATLASTSTTYLNPIATDGLNLVPQGNPLEWAQLSHDPQRTGFVETEVGANWSIAWIWNGPEPGKDGGPMSGHLRFPKAVQPVVGDGLLFIGHEDGVLRAVSQENGTLVWERPLGGSIINTAAYDQATNSIFVGSRNGVVYQVTSNGELLQSFATDSDLVMAPLVVGNTVFIGALNGVLYALSTDSLKLRWEYNAGAELWASPAFSALHDGLVIIQSEDRNVHAVQARTGQLRWREQVNANPNPDEPPGYAHFVDTYPVVSEANGVVLVRSFLSYEKMDRLPQDFSSPESVRAFLTQNPDLQSLFVLELDSGKPRFVAPVMLGGIGNGHLESIAPQPVIKRLADGSEVAYLFWRVDLGSNDDRQDTTIGELDLRTGAMRYVQDHRNEGSMRVPTDEQSPLSMGGNTLLHAHWMNLGAVRLGDRAQGGDSYQNPIRSQEMPPVLNTLAAGSCPERRSHFCPSDMYAPGDGYRLNPGFYVYYADERIYDREWTAPVRNAVISNGTIYWKSVDGAITAIRTSNSQIP
jgi:hypothetical protein